MRRVINNKKYDTDKATVIGSWDDGMPGDFDYICETLYKKRTGEYFVHGRGGARSRYAEEREDGWFGGGQSIMPLTVESAKKWAQENLKCEEYEAEFGEVAEDDGTTAVISCRVATAAKKALERTAASQGVTQAKALEHILLDL